jgi:hypothetical protein
MLKISLLSKLQVPVKFSVFDPKISPELEVWSDISIVALGFVE